MNRKFFEDSLATNDSQNQRGGVTPVSPGLGSPEVAQSSSSPATASEVDILINQIKQNESGDRGQE